MKLWKLMAAGTLAACTLVSSTHAQQLSNTSFETPDPSDPTFPLGWNSFNSARYREVGDGLLPAAVARTGTHCIDLATGADFIGYSSNIPMPRDAATAPRNNPGYTWGIGEAPLKAWGYFYIPSTDPLVGQNASPTFAGHRAGLKLELRRTVNDSVYVGAESLAIDPNNPNIETAIPGIVRVTTPNGPGIHTNNQWIRFELTVQQTAALYTNSGTGMVWDLPPMNPDAKVSVLPIRFGPPPVVAFSSGSVFWDDMGFQFGNPCIADFNGAGGVTVQDIFDFLSAWFQTLPTADVNGQGGVTVQDIFDFLAAWFVGCP